MFKKEGSQAMGLEPIHTIRTYRPPFHIMALPNFPSPSSLSRTNRGSHRLNRTRAFNTGIAISCLFLLGHKPQPLWRFCAAKVILMCSARANRRNFFYFFPLSTLILLSIICLFHIDSNFSEYSADKRVPLLAFSQSKSGIID